MSEFDILNPNIVRAYKRWSHAPVLAAHYKSLQAAYDGGHHEHVVDLSKSFLECACKTALRELSPDQPSGTATPTEILADLLKACGLENTRTGSKTNKFLSLHNKISDLVQEIRNEVGSASHGKDGFYEEICRNHARAYAISVDSLIGLVLGAIDGTSPSLRHTREKWERFSHINIIIDASSSAKASVAEDGALEITITTSSGDDIPVLLEASKILFYFDREAYIEAFNTAKSAADSLVRGIDD